MIVVGGKLKNSCFFLASVLVLSGCAQGQTNEEACDLVNDYVSEILATSDRISDDFRNDIVRTVGAENILRILDEMETKVRPGDSELNEVTKLWISSATEFFSMSYLEEIKDTDVDALTLTKENFQAVNSRLIRVCSD